MQAETLTLPRPTNPLAARPSPGAGPPSAVSTDPPPRNLRRILRDDHICILTFDRPGSAANIFDLQALKELGDELDDIARTPQLKGLILTSAKPSIFIAGADLEMVTGAASVEEAGAMIDAGQKAMNRLAALKVPTVAAVHGAAVGGGCELCLACDYRVASTDRATKIGLPETKLGLIPAWGGSTRLPRLVGLPKALDIILAGKTLAAKPALKCGLVDELAPQEYLMDVAARMIGRGKPLRSRRWPVNNRLVAALIASRLRPRLLKKTRGHYPAVTKALEVVTKGIFRTVSESLRLEREGILGLMQNEVCRNLIRVFFLQERAKKLRLPGFARDTELKSIKRAAVIGGGVMGAGIAQWLSARQLPVILRDINTEQVAKGLASIGKVYHEGVKRHLFTAREARDGMDRIFPAPTEVPLRHVDLVIEAAVEKLEVKKKIFQRLDELTDDQTVLATNTSALPISELAACTRVPERVVGLHFFNPVHRMQLVEIISARQTSPEVLQRAVRFVQQIGKLPVLVVKDSPGFIVNRILMPYLLEAGTLFEAGASITTLDEVMLDFGMPMGPMRLLDEVGVDVAIYVAQTLVAAYRERTMVPPMLAKMMQAGLLGRKTGAGFYLHPKGKEPFPNLQMTDYQSQTGDQPSPEKLRDRMVLVMINEAARCVEEEIIAEPADVDFAMIMGTGFAPFRGGPLRYADSLGASKVVEAMERFANNGSPQFAPCALLRSMAAGENKFYPSS